ncbi:MAG: hypothetical protein ACRDQZ_13090 [Mycobacteriales bacterium]
MPPTKNTFGRKVIGDEAFDTALREEKGGGSTFGVRVRDAIPETNTLNIAKRNSEMGVKVVNDVPASESLSVEDIEKLLDENPTFFDSLYEYELARDDGPRDDALKVFQSVERGIKGAGRHVVLDEINQLLGVTHATAGQRADLQQAHREQMDRQLRRQEENQQLIDADRIQALSERAENLDKIKASDSAGSKDQIVSADVDRQIAAIGDEKGLNVPGSTAGKSNAPKKADDTEPDYATQTKAELQEEADKRHLEVKGTGADGAVLKDDLVKALTKSDKQGK